MSFIAQRISYFDSSGFRDAIRKKALMKDPIDLSIGIPEEMTPAHIKLAGIQSIKNDKTVYTPANGIPELRVALATKLSSENKIICTSDNVTIVPGLTTGQLLVYLAIIDPGDEVIVFDPYYPPYPHLASMVGGNVVLVPVQSDFQPDIERLEQSVSSRTKAIVVNSPNNPTGAVYSEGTLRKIVEIAKRHNILIISDEIYEHFAYEERHFSIGSIYPHTITLNGFSKEYAMTGWRIGYVSGPTEIIHAINELQQYAVMSTSSIAQYAALAALGKPAALRSKYQAKRNLIRESLDKMGIQVQGAGGAFYMYLPVPAQLTDLQFVEKATKHELIIVPGRAFSRRHDHIRISYGADKKTLLRGMAALKQLYQETS